MIPSLTPTEYYKLLGFSIMVMNALRPQWAFFWFDRLTKSRSLYYNQATKTRRTGRDEPLTSDNVKRENPYEVYGTEVPNTITGRKGY